jgi:hypothetical protein
MSFSLKRIDSLQVKRNASESTQLSASSGSPLFQRFSALISDAQFLNNARIGSETRITIQLKKKNIVILNAAKNQIASFSIDAPQMQNTQRIVLDIFKIAFDSIHKVPLTPPISPPSPTTNTTSLQAYSPTSVQSHLLLQQKTQTPPPTPPPLSLVQSTSLSQHEKPLSVTSQKNILEHPELPIPSQHKVIASDQDSAPTSVLQQPTTPEPLFIPIPVQRQFTSMVSIPMSERVSPPIQPEVSTEQATQQLSSFISSSPKPPMHEVSFTTSEPIHPIQLQRQLTPPQLSNEQATQQLSLESFTASRPKPGTPKASFTTTEPISPIAIKSALAPLQLERSNPKQLELDGLISPTATDPLPTFSPKPLTPVDSREQSFPTATILQSNEIEVNSSFEQGKREREALIASESMPQPTGIPKPQKVTIPSSFRQGPLTPTKPAQKPSKPDNSWLTWLWPFGNPEPEMQNTLLEPFREEGGLFSSNFD